MKHPESLALAVAFAVLAGGVGMAHSQHYGANVPSDLVILAQAKSPSA